MSPRSLVVFRHGKSDWTSGTDEDRERPLASRGRRGAAAMGRFLAGIGEVPDLALTSPARRASDTLRIAAESGGWTCESLVREGLYGSLDDVLGELRLLGPAASVVIVGHEPTSSELVALLSGGGRVRLPTAAMVRLDLDADSWDDVHPGCGEIAWLVTPKLLGGKLDDR